MVVTLQFYNNFDTLLKIFNDFHRRTSTLKILEKFTSVFHFFLQNFWRWCKKNKSQKNVFESKKRKILKKFTGVYLLTIIDHDFFLILLSNREFCRKYFTIIEFSLCYLNRKKDVSRAVGEKIFRKNIHRCWK